MPLTRRNILASCLASFATPVWPNSPPLVFAAASLKGVLDDVARDVIPLRLAYGGSGAMARQIIHGAPADIFLPANPDWMDVVVAKREPLAQRVLLGNRLVVVRGRGVVEKDFRNFDASDRIAMGFVEAVPAGQYGKAAFEALDVWPQIEAAVVETESVSAALALVVAGAVPYAVVYATDAQSAPGVEIMFEFTPGLHPPITYPIALFSEDAREAYDVLSSSSAAEVFARAGFEVF